MERSARPRLAVAYTAGLLALTLALAWGLIEHKKRAMYIAMTDSRQLRDWPIHARVPEGWTEAPADQTPADVGVLAVAPDDDTRALAIVQGPTIDTLLPVATAPARFEAAIAWFGEGTPVRGARAQWTRFGPLPGVLYQWIVARSTSTPVMVIGVLGVTPDARSYAVLLRREGTPDRKDEALVRQVAAEITAPGLGITTDVAGPASACGLTVDAPSGTLAVPPAEGPISRLRLISAPGDQDPWVLELAAMPLAAGRTPEDVLADIASERTGLPVPSSAVERAEHNGRTAFGLIVTGGGPQDYLTKEVWVVPLSETNAVVLSGLCEGTVNALGEAVAQIAASVKSTDAAPKVDVAAASKRGEEMLAEIRAKGVSTWFQRWSSADLLYAFEQDGRVIGYQRVQYDRQFAGGEWAWYVEDSQYVELPGGGSLDSGHNELIAMDGVTYRLAEVQRRSAAGRRMASTPDIEHRYEEERRAGSDRVRKVLSVNGRDYRNELTAGAGFAAAGVLEIVYSLAAADAKTEPLIVRGTSTFSSGEVCIVVWPLGKRALPGANPPREVPAVTVMADSIAAPHTLYYDDDGTVLRHEFGYRTVLRRCTPQELRDILSLLPSSSRVR